MWPNSKLQTANSNVCKSRWLILLLHFDVFSTCSYGFLPSSHIGRSWSQALCRHWTAGCGERSVGGAAAAGIPWNQRSQRPGTLGGCRPAGMQMVCTHSIYWYILIYIDISYIICKLWCLMMLKIVLLFDESCGSLVFQDVETTWSMLGNSRQIDDSHGMGWNQ